MNPLLSVLIPTHNPQPERLLRTLDGLLRQTLPVGSWETLLIDNASTRFPDPAFFSRFGPSNLRIVSESKLGLTSARRRGFTEAQAPVAILVDDDNVLAPDFLAHALDLLSAHPRLGTLGGPVHPEFAVPPPAWSYEFHGLLALRDLGPAPIFSQGLRPPGASANTYPLHAPVGAGMVLRCEAWQVWLSELDRRPDAPSDRRGSDLTSGGDNDLVLSSLSAGWETAYFPALKLTHLIPASRLEPAYLARLNRGIQRSWVTVLRRHEACPWATVPYGTVLIRQARAYYIQRAWRGPAEFIRWQGVCGRFEGLAA